MSSDAYITDFNNALQDEGTNIRLRYFVKSYVAGGYDDDITLTSGTDVWTKAFVQHIDQTRGSSDAVLVQQGILLENDSRIYVQGDVSTSGVFKLQIGSPSGEQYGVIDNGIVPSPLVNGSLIYKKLYGRVLPTGSMYGE